MWKRAIFAAIVVSLMSAAAYASFFVAPTERTMGTLQRIFYFHAAAAWAGMTAFSVTFVANLLYVWRRQPRWDSLGDAERLAVLRRRRNIALGVAAGVMLARGALGNPWLFAELLGGRERGPTPEEVIAELDWTIDRAVEHLGQARATRYLRKFYPWYVPRLALDAQTAKRLQASLQSAETLDQVAELLGPARRPLAPAV